MREVIARARAKTPWLAEITPQKENEPEQWGSERSLPDRDRSISGDFPCRGTRNLNHTERLGRSLVLLTDNDTGFWCSGVREGLSWPFLQARKRVEIGGLQPGSQTMTCLLLPIRDHGRAVR